MNAPRDTALVSRFSPYNSAVEIGIGRRPEVAVGLAENGVTVTATDVVAVDVPESISFVRDDVVEASRRDDPGEWYHADLIYGLNLPPELHRPAAAVARTVDADFRFTTLGFDSPTASDSPSVSYTRESLPDGETLYGIRHR